MTWDWQGVQSWLTSLCPAPWASSPDLERRQAGCRKSQTRARGMLRIHSGTGQSFHHPGTAGKLIVPGRFSATRKGSLPHLGRVFSVTYLGLCHYSISSDTHLRSAATHPLCSSLPILESRLPLQAWRHVQWVAVHAHTLALHLTPETPMNSYFQPRTLLSPSLAP